MIIKTSMQLVSTTTCIVVFLLASCGSPQGGTPQGGTPAVPDQCFIDRINQPDISKSRDVQQLDCARSYPRMCTDAAIAAQAKCDADCLQYTKRRTIDPQTAGRLLACPADPVQTTIDAYNAATHCVRNPPGGTEMPYKVTCTVSYTCTCDP